MKFFNKHKRIIGFILTVTVSVMLFVSSIPASAAVTKYSLSYGSVVTSPVTSWGNSTSNMVSGITHTFGGPGAIALTNSNKSGFACLYRNQSYNGDLCFQFVCPKSWRPGFEDHSIDGFVVVKALDGTVICIPLSSFSTYKDNFKDYSPLESGNAYFNWNFTAAKQYAFMNDYGWGQAYFIGVGIRVNKSYTGTFTFSYVSHDNVSTVSSDSNHWYSPLTGFFSDIFDNLKSFFSTVYREHFQDTVTKLYLIGAGVSSGFQAVGDYFSRQIEDIGNLATNIWKLAKPYLQPILEYVLLPTLNSILEATNQIVTKAVEVFSPLIADIINFFAPYFNKINDIITDNFINLVSNLSPLVNQFVTAIAPSFESIVNNISSNISKIIKECFVPDNSSAEFKEFVSMKDDVTNKFPIFNQLYSFVSALFNPSTYSPGTSVSVTNLLRRYNNGTINSTQYFFYRCNYDFKKGNSYYITFNVSNSSEVGLHYVVSSSSGGYMSGPAIHNGTNTVLFEPSRSFAAFEFYSLFSSGTASITDICLYSVDSAAGSDFTVNVYGKNVSVLNFDWYMPYKHYGDILVISFCYLAFVWRTFKRLPQII